MPLDFCKKAEGARQQGCRVWNTRTNHGQASERRVCVISLGTQQPQAWPRKDRWLRLPRCAHCQRRSFAANGFCSHGPEAGWGGVGEGATRSRKPKSFPVLPEPRSLASSLPLDLVRVDTERAVRSCTVCDQVHASTIACIEAGIMWYRV